MQEMRPRRTGRHTGSYLLPGGSELCYDLVDIVDRRGEPGTLVEALQLFP